MQRVHAPALWILAILAIVAYLPVFQQPLLQDDYPNLEQMRTYAGSGWSTLLGDDVFRSRSTFYVMSYAVDRVFGLTPAAFYGASLLLHVLCTWLVYALGTWRAIGWRISGIAAAFFAVAEGHQEAVMWYSASAELLMFLFGVLSLLAWIRFLDGGRWRWYALALAAMVLALASKESAVIFAALAWVPASGRRPRLRAVTLWLPFAGLAALEVLLIFATRTHSFRFHDGSFSLTAPFWITLPASYVRLLWVWGFAALASVLLLGRMRYGRVLAIAGVWMALSLVPYSFLTYMHRVPSRQTYLASAGLALLVAAGFRIFEAHLRRGRKEILAATIGIVLVANVGMLWWKKRSQFLERAAPVEAMLSLARRVHGPIYMRCYPGPPIVYESALRLRSVPGASLLWDVQPGTKPPTEFCWSGR